MKTLIVDDSVVYRSQIRAALQDLPWIDILKAAPNGRIALERIERTSPDLLILDLEMPEMDGLETLKELRRRGMSCKTIVFSSVSKRGAEVTLESLRLGACDFIAKPGAEDDGDFLISGNPADRIRNLLLPKIQALFPDHTTNLHSNLPSKPTEAIKKYPKVLWDIFKPEIVLIGASTGGPTIIENIFASLKSSVRCPILIVQHMPPVFTTTFARRLGHISGLPAAEATDGMVLENGKIYLAPGDYHMRLHGDRFQTTISLDQGPPIHSVRPAVDPLFETAANIFRERCLALVLTGMGYDGKDGAIAVKHCGGAVVIQDKKSCAVFGMPGAVFSSGAYDKIATPDEITDLIRSKIGFAIPKPAASGKGV